MATKSGQARTLTAEQQDALFDAIRVNRHPEKNTAIMQISFRLGLRAQEISLLQIGDVAQLNAQGTDFQIKEILSVRAATTKGADAMGRSRIYYKPKRISFSTDEFDALVEKIILLVKAGHAVAPEDLYPPARKHKGKSRDLPLVDPILRDAIESYVSLRLSETGHLKPSDSLFITQKGGPYSPNTLQEHMGMMLKQWAQVERGSSHSGRRTVATNILHVQGQPVKVAQVVLGHVSPATTLIYTDPSEQAISEALGRISDS